jgi:hypothetical protein
MTMLRFTASRAAGLAVALMLATTVTAGAQDTTRTHPRRSRSQMPVRKQQPPAPAPSAAPTPAPTPETSVAPARHDTVFVGRTDTTVVMCNCAAAQAASTGEVLPLIPAKVQRFFGNGLYVGLGSGAMLPVGDLMNGYNPGWGINVPIGWDPPHSPVGARLNIGYVDLNSANPEQIAADSKQWSLDFDAKFRVPFGHFLKSTSSAYIVGGGAFHHFTNWNESVFRTNQFINTIYSTPAKNDAILAASQSESSSQNSFGIHGGVGLSMGVGPGELFVESRYTRVYTPGRAINYVPVIAGVTFH